MTPSESLHPKESQAAAYSPEHEHSMSMGGLVIGITVLPNSQSGAQPYLRR